MSDVVEVHTITGDSPSLLSGPDVTGEPKIHGIVGAYYGDMEVDIGKSVRWLNYYIDDLYIQDTNSGEQRYWVINWDASFPDAHHGVTGRNFFLDNANWRKEQFQAADKAWNYHDADWCIFIDGSEGLSWDNRGWPDDFLAAPFMSWMYREIERATGDSIVLPFYAYVKNSDLQNVTYRAWPVMDASVDVPAPSQAVSVPWYVPNQGLPRLFKVSALRDPDFDWTQLDKFVDWEVKAGTGGAATPAYLNPEVGQVSTPHNANIALTDGVTYRLSVQADVASMTSAYSSFVDKSTGNNIDYRFLLVQGNNIIYFEIAESTGTTYTDIPVVAPVPYGPTHTYVADFVPNTKTRLYLVRWCEDCADCAPDDACL